MVDYSKWDKFSDDEEEEAFQGPIVTTFEGEKGRSFVIGPKGANIVKSDTPSSSSLQSQKKKKDEDKMQAKESVFELDSKNGGTSLTLCD